MRIAKKSMNWFIKPSAWDHSQRQVARQRAMAKSMIAEQSNNAAMLGSVGTTNSQSAVELSIKQAVQRITSKKA